MPRPPGDVTGSSPPAHQAVRKAVPRGGCGCPGVAGAGRCLLGEGAPPIGGVPPSSLRSHGHEVLWARTGATAVRSAESPVDLVLLDLGLPDIDGVEVCRQLRRLQPGCVVVMLTARAEEMDVVVGLEAGADDYLVKPVRLVEFHARIRAHLGRSDGEPTAPPVRSVGDLVVDMARRRITLAGRELP